MSNPKTDWNEKAIIEGNKVYVCPCCGDRPDERAVTAGIEEANCNNGDCLVGSYQLWPEVDSE